jgi:DENN domain-containing protein 11
LEEYWEKNRIRDENSAEAADDDSPVVGTRSKGSPQPNGYRRPRGISDATAVMSSHQLLSAHHPAISLPGFITAFGPLIFPLYRAALLRKRILLVGDAPVEPNCNFGNIPARPSRESSSIDFS